MKKLLTKCKVFTVLVVLALTSCQDENNQVLQENPSEKVSLSDLKREITPSSQIIPEAVKIQLDESKKNIEKYLKSDLKIEGIAVLGKLSTEKSVSLSQNLISQKDNFVATGNILDPESVKVGKLENLNSGEDLSIAQKGLKEMAAEEIKANANVLEINWNHKGEKFSTICYYNDSGIIWDNILGGLVMMDKRGNSEVSNDAAAKVSSKWYKQWWTANWLWGSKRGEIGYQITIYYTGSSVSNVDVSDWGSISLGKAKSESKVLKKTGAYGQCRYALGLCTPVGSLSFNSSNFSVSFSGLGSNVVSNGTKSLYP